MLSILGVMIVLAQGVIIALLFGAIRSFGEYVSSSNLLHAAVVDALKEIALIGARQQPAVPPPPPRSEFH